MVISDTLILGGGIMGLSCAVEEARRGKNVTLVDTAAMGTKSSWASAGILTHRGARKTHSPFRQLQIQSIEQFPTWLDSLETLIGTRVPMESPGEFQLFDRNTEAGQNAYNQELEKLKREESNSYLEIENLPGKHALLPRGGDWKILHFPYESRVDPRLLLKALKAACVNLRVTLISNAERSHLKTKNSLIELELLVDGEQFIHNSSQVVVAAGAWCNSVLTSFDVKIPLLPVKGQMIRIPRLYNGDFFLHLNRDTYIIPRGDSMLVGSTTEARVWDEEATDEGRNDLLNRVSPLFPEKDMEILESWAGLRSRTKDRTPCIGSVDDKNRIFLITGHYKSGIGMAPLSARCLSQLMNGEKPDVEMAAFDPRRFK